MFDRLNNLARGRAGDDRIFAPRRLRSLSFLAALLVLVVVVAVRVRAGRMQGRAQKVALLVPGAAERLPLVEVWRDAAREEGVPLEVVSDASFLRPRFGAGTDYAGVILPDSVHLEASALLLQQLERFVEGGGWLFVAYDAATHDDRGAWYPVAPLSRLVGVEYGLYAALRDGTIVRGHLVGTPEALQAIEIPPGKTMDPEVPGGLRAISGYHYGRLDYPSFATRGTYAGRTLLTAAGGLGAGWRPVGRGGVLFVNLPLGYLAGQTDGLLLHAFLRYFASRLLGLPVLSAAPNGVGGLIFNVHLDANGAMEPLLELASQGLLEQGPFSIHITAGPDTYRFGDGAGLDLDHNAELKSLVRRFIARGDAIGSHGGWIHNYFGEHVKEDNQAEMERFLALNADAIERVTGKPCLEYSAPAGNQPRWVTRWLEAHGFLAYYFTGNSGMAPTRSYRGGRLDTRRIWSFPISVRGELAAFEEAEEAGVSQDEVENWLVALSEFAADTGTIRTFYSHPPGWEHYTAAIRGWLEQTRALAAEGRFSFYTMTRVAEFLDRREGATWQAHLEGEGLRVEAHHPSSLAELTWTLPRSRYQEPAILSGAATVRASQSLWLVTASEGRTLRFFAPRSLPQGPEAPRG